MNETLIKLNKIADKFAPIINKFAPVVDKFSPSVDKFSTVVEQFAQAVNSIPSNIPVDNGITSNTVVPNVPDYAKNVSEIQTYFNKTLGSIQQEFQLLQQRLSNIFKMKIAAENAQNLSGSIQNVLDTPVQIGIAFGEIMSKIAAKLGFFNKSPTNSKSVIYDDRLKSLIENTKTLSEDTKWNATQFAESFLILLDSFDISQIPKISKTISQATTAIDGNLKEVAESFMGLSTAMFGDDADKQFQYMSDVVNYTAHKIKLDVIDFSKSLEDTAPAAVKAGINFETLNAIIANLKQTDIDPKILNSSAQDIITKFSDPSDQIKKVLNKLNIPEFDQTDKSKYIINVLEALSQNMSGLGGKEKSNIISQLAGSKSNSAGLKALLNQIEQGLGQKTKDNPQGLSELKLYIQELGINGVGVKGFTEKLAAVMKNNLDGSIDKLWAALHNLYINVYTKIQPVLVYVSETIHDVINSINTWIDKHEGLSNALFKFITILGLVSAVAAIFLTVIAGIITIAATLMFSFSALVGLIPLLLPLSAIALAIYHNWDALVVIFNSVWQNIQYIGKSISDFWSSLSTPVQTAILFFASLIAVVLAVGVVITAVTAGFIGIPGLVVTGIALGIAFIGTFFDEIKDSVSHFFTWIDELFSSINIQTILSSLFVILIALPPLLKMGFVSFIGTVLKSIKHMVGVIWQSLKNVVNRAASLPKAMGEKIKPKRQGGQDSTTKSGSRFNPFSSSGNNQSVENTINNAAKAITQAIHQTSDEIRRAISKISGVRKTNRTSSVLPNPVNSPTLHPAMKQYNRIKLEAEATQWVGQVRAERLERPGEKMHSSSFTKAQEFARRYSKETGSSYHEAMDRIGAQRISGTTDKKPKIPPAENAKLHSWQRFILSEQKSPLANQDYFDNDQSIIIAIDKAADDIVRAINRACGMSDSLTGGSNSTSDADNRGSNSQQDSNKKTSNNHSDTAPDTNNKKGGWNRGATKWGLGLAAIAGLGLFSSGAFASENKDQSTLDFNLPQVPGAENIPQIPESIGIFESITNGFSDAWKWIETSLASLGIPASFLSLLLFFVDIPSLIMSIAGKLFSLGGTLFSTIGGLMGKIPGLLSAAGSGLWSLGSKAASAVKTMGTTVASSIGKVLGHVPELAKSASSGLQNVWSKAATTVKSIGTKIASSTSNIVSNLYSVAKNAASKLASLSSQAANIAKNAASTATNVASKAASTAANVASKAASTAGQIISKAPGMLASAGTLINGIPAMGAGGMAVAGGLVAGAGVAGYATGTYLYNNVPMVREGARYAIEGIVKGGAIVAESASKFWDGAKSFFSAENWGATTVYASEQANAISNNATALANETMTATQQKVAEVQSSVSINATALANETMTATQQKVAEVQSSVSTNTATLTNETMATTQQKVNEVQDSISTSWQTTQTTVTGQTKELGEKAVQTWDTAQTNIQNGLKEVNDLVGQQNWEQEGASTVKTWADGVASAHKVAKNQVVKLFESIDYLLNHSDAKEGPLSQTSKTGRSFVSTWLFGVNKEKGTAKSKVSQFFGRVITGAKKLISGAKLPKLSVPEIETKGLKDPATRIFGGEKAKEGFKTPKGILRPAASFLNKAVQAPGNLIDGVLDGAFNLLFGGEIDTGIKEGVPIIPEPLTMNSGLPHSEATFEKPSVFDFSTPTLPHSEATFEKSSVFDFSTPTLPNKSAEPKFNPPTVVDIPSTQPLPNIDTSAKTTTLEKAQTAITQANTQSKTITFGDININIDAAASIEDAEAIATTVIQKLKAQMANDLNDAMYDL
ncbi:phage tail tape measure protein [Candidatus Albibeggiatoa sp. nov. BB20]|uniref:phage tail tape measure protein n=1 Tax=Candidatus Albibeggiatoa sp. nov. BB20 TaxID=3162723 RepID=UPI00336552B1